MRDRKLEMERINGELQLLFCTYHTPIIILMISVKFKSDGSMLYRVFFYLNTKKYLLTKKCYIRNVQIV